MKHAKRFRPWVLAISAMLLVPHVIALADTGGSEIQTADRPDQLVLQLGPQWAGLEFELRTDAGVFPVPVVVDQLGVLKMDLGGSRTYTLSCLAPPAPVPAAPEQQPEIQPPAQPTPEPPAENAAPEAAPLQPEPPAPGVPGMHLLLFLAGIAAATGGLFAMKYFKRRRECSGYDDYDDEYD